MAAMGTLPASETTRRRLSLAFLSPQTMYRCTQQHMPRKPTTPAPMDTPIVASELRRGEGGGSGVLNTMRRKAPYAGGPTTTTEFPFDRKSHNEFDASQNTGLVNVLSSGRTHVWFPHVTVYCCQSPSEILVATIRDDPSSNTRPQPESGPPMVTMQPRYNVMFGPSRRVLDDSPLLMSISIVKLSRRRKCGMEATLHEMSIGMRGSMSHGRPPSVGCGNGQYRVAPAPLQCWLPGSIANDSPFTIVAVATKIHSAPCRMDASGKCADGAAETPMGTAPRRSTRKLENKATETGEREKGPPHPGATATDAVGRSRLQTAMTRQTHNANTFWYYHGYTYTHGMSMPSYWCIGND